MITTFEKTLILCTALSFVLAVQSGNAAFAQGHCKLGPAAVSATEVTVKVTCGARAEPGTTPYPVGPLYLGVTLFELDSEYAGLVAPHRDIGDHLDLAAKEFSRPTGTIELKFPLPANTAQTHILVAVWDQKNVCADCRSEGFTYGKVDKDELPVPVDVWPSPICDVASLKARGYFRWTAEQSLGDPDDGDSDMARLSSATDCWSYKSTWPGRGVSYQRWRVAPVRR